VPFTATGKLGIVASSSLGGLGAKDGPPVEYNWVMPSIAPQLLPWLAVLGLLALKPNRRPAAWLIWLPLGCVLLLTFAPPILPAGTDFASDIAIALATGLAAVWLLSSHLRQWHRLLVFFYVLFVMAGFSALAIISMRGWDLLSSNTLAAGIVLGVGVLATSLALSLDGLICRSRYRPLGLYLWMLIPLVGLWLAIATPFFVIALVTSGGRIPWGDFFAPVLTVAMVNFATLLPFLILSSASPFFRDRLKALLHVQPEAPPRLNTPAPVASIRT
jgi:hypothetical protein